MGNLLVNAKKLAQSHKAASLVDCPRDEATLLSLANYGDMTHVQIVGARHAVPVFQGHCILRASIEAGLNLPAGRVARPSRARRFLKTKLLPYWTPLCLSYIIRAAG